VQAGRLRDPPAWRDAYQAARHRAIQGIEDLRFHPGDRNVILGPNNSDKSTVLEHSTSSFIRASVDRRPAPDELDYFQRDPSQGFEVEAVMVDLPQGVRRTDVFSPPPAKGHDCVTSRGLLESHLAPRPGKFLVLVPSSTRWRRPRRKG
jgi:hypothetical protein